MQIEASGNSSYAKEPSQQSNTSILTVLIVIIFLVLIIIVLFMKVVCDGEFRHHRRYRISRVVHDLDVLKLESKHLLQIGEYVYDPVQHQSLLHSHEPEDDSYKCTICLNSFIKGDICRTMPEPCQHTFHKTCIDEWFLRSSRCPLCKRSIFLILEGDDQPQEAQANGEEASRAV